MAQGRGSPKVLGLAALLLCLLVHTDIADAARFFVGGSGGWAPNIINWPNGKSFKAGDLLVFIYNPSNHNVVSVNAAGYNGCSVPSGSKTYTSGSDRILLRRGRNYFICSFPGHCAADMKISVDAA